MAAVRYDFSSSVVLVVGASRGIGAGTARAFARAGAAVVLASRSQEALDAVAASIEADGGRAFAVATDATDPAQVERLVATTVERFGRLDVAFNNTTDGPMPAPLAELDVEGFDAGIAGNVRATFLACKHEIPAIVASGGGSVINMASIAGVRGTANLAAYVAGKAGVIALTRVAALDYADAGVRVNVVAPGPILTEHLEAAGERAQQLAAGSVPLGRVGSVEDVASVVLWLASEGAAFVTGATISVDGGQAAGSKPPQMTRDGDATSDG